MPTVSTQYQQRFGGIDRLYGNGALEKLASAHFTVIGIGGVGTWASEALARSGVGAITLIDMDDICITNTNRQAHTLQQTVGQSKIAVMAQRLKDINPDIIVHEVEDFLDTENIAELITEKMDFVIDAIDTANAKTALIAWCKRNKMPLITVGSAGGKRDPRMITSVDLSRTVNDPMLAKVRNQLRRLHNFTRNTKRKFGIEAVYSEEQMVYPQANGEVCQQKSDMADGVKLDCSGGFGAATMITGSFGFTAASRAIEKFLAK